MVPLQVGYVRPFCVFYYRYTLKSHALQLFTVETKIHNVIKMILLNYNRRKTCANI
jgi:hypothetical protein